MVNDFSFTVHKKINIMKQLFSFLFLAITAGAFATVHTVSNNPATLAQFNNINTAVTAAATGDTIYIHGSPNAYFAFTQTNKQLTFIGPGFSPEKNLGFTALVPGCTITGALCANSEYQGITFTSTISINSAVPNNLRFIRNNFSQLSISINQGGVTYSGYLFEGNLFDNSSADAATNSTYQNFLFQNNYFYESACCRDANIGGFFNTTNVLFDHNLWFGAGSGVRNAFTNSCRFLTITNNVFVRRNASSSNSNSVFNNNITFYPAGSVNPGAPWTLNGNVNGGGNADNLDPQMVAQASVNAGTNNSIADYTIPAGPANNTGSDGKDMGLLYDVTGSLNFTNSRNARLPRIFSMNVITPTVAAGANVTINVDARISN
jgi:hypothetical protein